MSENQINNKRIAKNTGLLYIRMIFLLCISFYTTRAVLDVLGVVDLGIYNVVGGIVAMFSFINGSLSSASSRFITYELGRGDKTEIQKTFNTIVTVHYLFGVVLFIIAETAGLWFVLNKLVIPDERTTAAFWVYQSAVLSAVIVIASAPFNAQIIAHEKMSAFSYISIYEGVAKLAIVLLLYLCKTDKLIFYAFSLVCVQISVRCMYAYYCNRHFEESSYKLEWCRDRIKTVFSYAGWVVTGSVAFLSCTQGLNIILNLFFGPAVNAARALAVQLQAALNQFTTSFMTAVKPQITKSYAQGDLTRMHSLVLSGSKLGALLMVAVLVPIITNTEFLLGLWLKEIPEHTIIFVRIMLLTCVVRTLMDTTMAAIHATGDIRKAEIVEACCMFSLLPIAYVLLKFFSVTPEVVMVVYLICEIYTQFGRVWVIYPKVGLSRKDFVTRIIMPVLASGLISFAVCVILKQILYSDSIICSLLFLFFSFIITVISIWIAGINSVERNLTRDAIKKITDRVFRRG